jgi:FlaA1/EpsC-like NDP-sugar epimerase
LSGLRVETPSKKFDELNPVSRIIMTLAVRRRFLEVILDFFLIGVLYYLAFLIYYRFSLNDELFTSFIRSFPIIVISTYISFYIFGVYRSVWHYLVFDDLVRLFKASIGSLTITAAALLLLNAFPNKIIPVELEPEIIFLYSIFLFIGLGLSRSSFRVLRNISGRQRSPIEEKVLVYGMTDQAQLTLSWIQSDINKKYYPVGIIADDPLLTGRLIQGLEVLGGDSDIPELIREHQITGLLIAVDGISEGRIKKLHEICIQHECWIRRLKIDFELVE